MSFFVCAAVKQLDPAHPLDYEGAVVCSCVCRSLWSGLEQNLDQSVKVCLVSTVLLKDKSYINSVFISKVT